MALTACRQNTKMKERLSSLGFAMAVEPVPNHTQLTSDNLHEISGIAEAYAEDDRRFQRTSSTDTICRSAHSSGHPFTSTERPLKRQRVDSPLPQGIRIGPPSSRDMMPPPPKPLSRMRSVRGLIPTIRKKLSGARSSPKQQQEQNDGDAQMYDHARCRSAADSCMQDDQSLPCGDLVSEPSYVSGDLPKEKVQQESRLLANSGQHTGTSAFSLRASSLVKTNGGRSEQHPVKMPTGPSYLHLLDGLSRDNSVEFGLRDPRENVTTRQAVASSTRPPFSMPQIQHQGPEVSNQQRWQPGDAFLHQLPNATPRPGNEERISQRKRSQGFFSRADYDPLAGPARPAPPQPQRPVHHIQNVVSSPFFGRSHVDAPPSTRSRITETEPSSHRSAASRSQRHLTSQSTTERRERSSLNGLSFFEAPVDAKNGPITHKLYQQPSRHASLQTYETVNVSRPGVNHTSSVFDRGLTAYARPTFPRQQQAQLPPRVPPSSISYSRGPPSHIGQLPSLMPSVVSIHSPVRNRTQWDTLQRAGVRSRCQSFERMPNNSFNTGLTYLFARGERHGVRR